jgi:hypothetical protein
MHFRSCLPGTDWLRRSVLWADDLAAIWPRSDPIPFGLAQQQSWREIDELRQARLFMPEYIFERDDIAQATLKELRAIGAGEPVSESWRDGAPAVGRIPPRDETELRLNDPSMYVHPEKLPQALTVKLLDRKLIKPVRSGHGYEFSSPTILDDLLDAGACALYTLSGGRLLPDVAEPAQARRIAAPRASPQGADAVVLAVNGATTPNMRTDFRHFIDFRLDARNERARRDYIDELVEVWGLCSDGPPGHAAGEVAKRMSADLEKARASYFDRVGLRNLIIGGLGLFAAVIPLAAGLTAPNVLVALAGMGVFASAVTVRNDAPRFVRSMADSDLLASTART